MKRKFYFILAIALLMISCNVNKNKNNKEEINIAAILSLTGNGAEYGQDQLNAIQLFQEELAKNYTLKYKYVFHIQDSKSQPKEAVNAYQNLSSRINIDACMTVLSSVCLALIPNTERDNIPIFCVGANPEITKNKSLVFRSLPTTDYQAKFLAKTVFDEMELDSIGILYLNDDFGIGSKNSFTQIALAKNKKILIEQSIQNSDVDYRSQITKLLSKKPNAIYLATFGNSIATALIQLKELGYEGYILSTLEVAYPKVLERAKNSSEGVIFTDTYWDINSDDFFQKYQNRFNKNPSLDVILAHDELNVLIQAFEQFGKENSKFSLLKGNQKLYNSPAGKFSINSFGDFEYSLKLKEIKNGTPQIID